MLTLVQVVPPPSRADWFLDPSMGSDVAERRKPSSARYLVAGAAAVSAALIVVALVGPALTDPKSAADASAPTAGGGSTCDVRQRHCTAQLPVLQQAFRRISRRSHRSLSLV